jgi:hypothetical protein
MLQATKQQKLLCCFVAFWAHAINARLWRASVAMAIAPDSGVFSASQPDARNNAPPLAGGVEF